MKKILAACSALVAVAFAGQASASEKIKLSVGGHMEQYVGVSYMDDNFGARKNGIQSDTKIHFKGSTTLDNGIEMGAKVELEGESSGKIDQQYLYINGGFGSIKMGAVDGTASDMAIKAPKAGGYSIEDWTNDDFNMDTNYYYGDTQKVTYSTPVLGNFSAGVSYAHSSESEDDDTKAMKGLEASIWDAGIKFERDFGGVSLDVSAVGQFTNPRVGADGQADFYYENGKSYTLGANVGFGNWTVGGSYGGHNEWFDNTRKDAKGFDLGVSYSMDAANVALTYAWEKREAYDLNDTATTLLTNENGEAKVQALSLGLDYTIGDGIIWNSNLFWAKSEADKIEDSGDAYGLITGLKLNF